MRSLLAFITCLSIHTVVFADWKINERVDAMTDEVKKTAVVTNELGHTFSVYRISKGGAVWGNFALSNDTFDQVDWEKPPIYRVDKNEPTNLAKMKELQQIGLRIQAYEWEPKWVNFLMWHGKEDEGISNGLVQLMEGKNVVFRYFLSTGGYKDTYFSLKGAASAISGAIGISKKIDHSAQQKSEEFKQAMLVESKRCQLNMKTFKTCFNKVNECRKQANQDTTKFMACLK